LDSSSSGQGPMEGSCEHDNEPSYSIEDGELACQERSCTMDLSK